MREADCSVEDGIGKDEEEEEKDSIEEEGILCEAEARETAGDNTAGGCG